jgi:3-deoxy-D-manno-octulosonic-acid transferase
MVFLYNTGIFFYRLFIFIASVNGNKKAKQWIEGRKDWRKKLKETTSGSTQKKIWFHCSSLGEFEQGRPVIEKIKKDFPAHQIVLTFFSPSGYEIRKNYQGADLIMYLPLDTASNANEFISLINPKAVFFIKYEFWHHYLSVLKQKNIPVFFISSNFRPGQIFFRSYGMFFKNMLKKITCLMVQNNQSARLLTEAGITNFIISGDTRFDRVTEISASPLPLPIAEKFADGKTIIIAGSTWPEDENILLAVFTKLPGSLKLIIAPHETNPEHIESLKSKAEHLAGKDNVCTYSNTDEKAKILIVDSIGLLSSLYQYGSIAWIGGGFGAGIHNTLEAAAFGIPVIFGPNYGKFNEAIELIQEGGAFSVHNETEASEKMTKLLQDQNFRNSSGQIAKKYIEKNKGATKKIIEIAKDYLKN